MIDTAIKMILKIMLAKLFLLQIIPRRKKSTVAIMLNISCMFYKLLNVKINSATSSGVCLGITSDPSSISIHLPS